MNPQGYPNSFFVPTDDTGRDTDLFVTGILVTGTGTCHVK